MAAWAIMGVTSDSLVVPRDFGNQEKSALPTLTRTRALNAPKSGT